MTVNIVIESQEDTSFNKKRLKGLSTQTLNEEGIDNGELGVVFVNEDTIRGLNLKYRSIDSPTDVLSFPIDERDSTEQVVLLGDVVICMQVAERNATAAGISFQEELERLLVHGILHVIGYDHTDDPEDPMFRRQEQILNSFRLGDRASGA